MDNKTVYNNILSKHEQMLLSGLRDVAGESFPTMLATLARVQRDFPENDLWETILEVAAELAERQVASAYWKLTLETVRILFPEENPDTRELMEGAIGEKHRDDFNGFTEDDSVRLYIQVLVLFVALQDKIQRASIENN